MSNKLTPVIIDNPCQKCWQYRTRDTLMALVTLGLWLLVLSRLYDFYAVEEALLERLYSATMLQLLVAGFIATFLAFHLWAMYNRYLHVSVLRQAERAAKLSTPDPQVELGETRWQIDAPLYERKETVH
ncbi:hypothetical protein ACGK9R_09890 [Halomonas sp. HNIBRBA4712]|uniref:hypothetical protein n=1 Tax=Halomonas sp. HNIBRBA4712 TaxID=3373087 RepID=UPI0037463ECB